MKHSISMIIAVAGFAIAAAVPATAVAESFECDLALNQVQLSASSYADRDSASQWSNVAVRGNSKPVIANYDADQKAFQQQLELTAAYDAQILAMGLPMIRKMVGVESRFLSEHADSEPRFCAVY